MLLLFLYKLSTQWMQIIIYTIRKVLLLLQLDNYSIDERFLVLKVSKCS